MAPRHALALTAIGTVRGRVSRRELCLASIEAELALVLSADHVLDGAPFTSISVVIHLGEAFLPPRIWGTVAQTLEMSVGVPFAEVRRRDSEHVCAVMRRATVDALVACCERYNLPVQALRDRW